MYCPNCGMQIPEGANYCTECGANLQSPEVPKNYCRICGSKIDPIFLTCPICGNKIVDNQEQPSQKREAPVPQPKTASTRPPTQRKHSISCPRCQNSNVSIQVVQENMGSKTITKARSKTKQKKHGFFWWFFIGWWWWIIDLFLWIFIFPFRFAYGVLKKKKYTTSSKSVSSTKNRIRYRKICTCQECGKTWEL